MPVYAQLIPMPALTGGVNRFDAEAKPNQAVDALDVINDDGDLRRRDAFISIAQAAPHVLPCGLGIIEAWNGAAWTQYVTRAFTVTSFQYFLFGCTEVFDCIDWRHGAITGTPTSNPGHVQLQLSYSIDDGAGGLAWQLMPRGSFLDKTYYIPGTTYGQSLGQDGRISWHRSLMPGWVSRIVDGGGKYWIKVEAFRTSTQAAINWSALNTVIAVGSPGVRAGLFGAVNGIFPMRLRGARKVFIIASDRKPRRGQELGAQLAVWHQFARESDEMVLVRDEGAGVNGSFNATNIQRDQGSGTWVEQQAASGTVGTGGAVVEKSNKGTPGNVYEWLPYQFTGGPLFDKLTPVAGTTASELKIVIPVGPSLDSAQRYEHHRLMCSVGDAQVPLYTTTEITKVTKDGTYWYIDFYPAWAGGVAGGTARFQIFPPPSVVRFAQDVLPRDVEVCRNANTAAHVQATAFNTSYAVNGSAASANKPVHFEISRRVPWEVPSGVHWCAALDTTTFEALLINGESGLLKFDGRRLRVYLCDTTSKDAQNAVGRYTDAAQQQNLPESLADSALHLRPPPGKYLVDFNGRLIMAYPPGRPRDIAWSQPGYVNNIWRVGDQLPCRDANNEELTGLAVLSGRLLAFTQSTIFEGSMEGLGQSQLLIFHPISRGVGFVSQYATAVIPMSTMYGNADFLVGVSPGGIIAYNHGDPMWLLERFERALDGGVNASALAGALAVAWPQRNLVLFALPGRGSSTNNRILAYDTERKAFWPWSAPFGISAMALERSDAGVEYVLFGTTDGHVMTLANYSTDDSNQIVGYARSAPLRPFGAKGAAWGMLQVTARELGATDSMGLRYFIDKHQVTEQDITLTLDDGAALFGGGNFDDAAMALADDHFDVQRVNISTASSKHKGHMLQYEARGSSRWRVRQVQAGARPLGTKGT